MPAVKNKNRPSKLLSVTKINTVKHYDVSSEHSSTRCSVNYLRKHKKLGVTERHITQLITHGETKGYSEEKELAIKIEPS